MADSGLRVDRCVCYDVSFAELQAIAERTVWALQQHHTFGRNCRLCLPYVRRMLRTGETVFHEVVEE
jgi:hypothetical protein